MGRPSLSTGSGPPTTNDVHRLRLHSVATHGVTGSHGASLSSLLCRSSVGADGGVVGWRLIAQGGMPVVVVFLLPVSDHSPRLGQRPEDIDVEAFVAYTGIERSRC